MCEKDTKCSGQVAQHTCRYACICENQVCDDVVVLHHVGLLATCAHKTCISRRVQVNIYMRPHKLCDVYMLYSAHKAMKVRACTRSGVSTCMHAYLGKCIS